LNNNRNNNNNNRRRGRGNNNRQQGGQQLNRIDSRARGNAPQLLEKYRKLAHDAHLNGDRVTEEYNLQFADHYFRVIADQRVRQEESRQPRREDRPASEYGDDEGEEDFYGENSPYNSSSPYANGGQPMQNNANGGSDNRGDNRNEQRGERQPRPDQNRADRGDRGDRGEQSYQERQPRQDRQERQERQPRRERQERPPVSEAPAPSPEVAATPVADQAVYEPTENPFLREERPAASRSLRPRRQRRPADEQAPAADASDEPAATLDLPGLPPAISRTRGASRATAAPVETAAQDDGRSEAVPTEEVAAEASVKPKRRTRRAAPPADDTSDTLEILN